MKYSIKPRAGFRGMTAGCRCRCRFLICEAPSILQHGNALNYTPSTTCTRRARACYDAQRYWLWSPGDCTMLASFECYCAKGCSHHCFEPINFWLHFFKLRTSECCVSSCHGRATLLDECPCGCTAEPSPTNPHILSEGFFVPVSALYFSWLASIDLRNVPS